jgi:ribosomal protein S6
MAKYEIDLLVNGSLDESAAKGTIKEFVSLIENQKNFKVDELGNKTLAYKIDKQTNA